MTSNQKSTEIIKLFNLTPHPEGGWFKEIIRSNSCLKREDGETRSYITGIYYLLKIQMNIQKNLKDFLKKL